MSEQSVFSGRSVVYYFDSAKKTWAPSPVAGYTRLDIYKNMGTGACRVIGRGMEDPNQVVINSALTKDTSYVRTRDQFHQFQDPRYLYGLSFGSPADAEAFAAAFEKEVAVLKGGGGAKPAAPVPVAQKAAPVAAPVAKPAAPAPPAAAPKPAPGAPPPPPAKGPPPPPAKGPPKAKNLAGPPADGELPESDSGRNAMLDSIQAFSKNKLKKAETVDKSGPLLATAKPAASAAPAGGDGEAAAPRGGGGGAAKGGGGGMMGGGDMMGAILAKRAAMQKQNSSAAVVPAAAAPTPEPKKPAPAPAASKTGTLTRADAPKPTTPTAGKPKPPPTRTPSHLDLTHDAHEAGGPSPRAPAGGELPAHLQTLKEEIMTEIRAELAQMKAEILSAISAGTGGGY